MKNNIESYKESRVVKKVVEKKKAKMIHNTIKYTFITREYITLSSTPEHES
jgi:hypothetical protein